LRVVGEYGDGRTALEAMHLLDVADVELVEGDRNYVKVTVGRGLFHARGTLQQAEKSLQSQPILRISRSCLVNVNHVHELSRTHTGGFYLRTCRRFDRHEQRGVS
jgi:two-component system, LytTR family, response regulator